MRLKLEKLLARSPLARFRRSDGGMAAVEFAMIVPVMFFLFVGAVEFSQALTVDRRVTQSASSVADLVARVTRLDATAVDNLMKVVEQLMSPYDVNALTVTIVSVKAVNSGGPDPKMTVDWSRNNHKQTPYARGAVYTHIPKGLIAVGESVIVGEATYNYTPLIFNYFIQSAFSMEERFFLKPRQTSCVSLDPINCVTGNNF